MDIEIFERVSEVAEYILAKRCTQRDASIHFGVSKSTINKDMKIRLPDVRPDLVSDMQILAEQNIIEGRVRGGLSRYGGRVD